MSLQRGSHHKHNEVSQYDGDDRGYTREYTETVRSTTGAFGGWLGGNNHEVEKKTSETYHPRPPQNIEKTPEDLYFTMGLCMLVGFLLALLCVCVIWVCYLRRINSNKHVKVHND